MLPPALLPAGQLTAMRAKAVEFMVHTATVMQPTITYDDYGKQIVNTTITYSGAAYFGQLIGKDREMLVSFAPPDKMSGEKLGNVTSHTALCLLPFETTVQVDDIIGNGSELWRVRWTNNDTMNAVQIYTKCIVERIAYSDKADYYTKSDVAIIDSLLTELGYALTNENGDEITI